MLKVLGSSSKGNCYILQDEKDALIIDAGVKFQEVKKALSYDIGKVKGCLITHEHFDHCKYAEKMTLSGIDVYMSKGTQEVLGLEHHRVKIIKAPNQISVGNFDVLPFDVKHDCAEPLGFLIRHKNMGNLLYATDTFYIEYTFDDLNHILVECNYSLDILNENVDSGKVHPAMKKRVMRSHFELENVKDFLRSNNLKEVRNIALLHLSDGNSDSNKFKAEIEEITGKQVVIADKGVELDVSLFPF